MEPSKFSFDNYIMPRFLRNGRYDYVFCEKIFLGQFQSIPRIGIVGMRIGACLTEIHWKPGDLFGALP